MSEPTMVTRRSFLRGGVLLVCAAPGLASEGCASSDEPAAPGAPAASALPTKVGPWTVPADTTLAPRHYALLCAVADALLPGDDASPGAHLAGAAFYIDQLLGAFRVDPPRIFAGGPYSGRHGGEAGFASFQRLTRVEELRWRTTLEGSRGLPEREWNGPVVGLVERYPAGLDAIDASATTTFGESFLTLDLTRRQTILGGADPDFVQLAYEHVVEGTWGDPAYGGNADMLGWKAIRYEGDRQPIGFSAREMSNPEEG